AARKQDQLPGEEEAEEEGREEAAEDEVPPVGSRAPLHMLCDSGGGHSRRKGNRGVRPERVQKAFCLIELTCLGPMSTIVVRERTRSPQESGIGQRQAGQKPVVQEKGGEIAEMLSLYMKLRSLTTRQEGQGMVEYALILVLVSIVVIVILLTMGNQIKNVFSNVVAALGA